jgi:hypothetical protein
MSGGEMLRSAAGVMAIAATFLALIDFLISATEKIH